MRHCYASLYITAAHYSQSTNFSNGPNHPGDRNMNMTAKYVRILKQAV
jgi:hypothetical protein